MRENPFRSPSESPGTESAPCSGDMESCKLIGFKVVESGSESIESRRTILPSLSIPLLSGMSILSGNFVKVSDADVLSGALRGVVFFCAQTKLKARIIAIYSVSCLKVVVGSPDDATMETKVATLRFGRN